MASISYQKLGGGVGSGSGGVPAYPLLAPNGTAAAPSHSFQNATNFGMFYDSTNTALGFSAGGAELFRMTASNTYFSQPIFNGVIALFTNYASVTNSIVPANTAGTSVSLFTSGRIVQPAAASFTLNNGYNGVAYVCTGSPTVTLPTSGVQIGDTYTITNGGSGTVVISVPSGASLYYGNSSKIGASTLTSAAQGASMTITLKQSGTWYATALLGTWS